jgi:uridine nucleosidase
LTNVALLFRVYPKVATHIKGLSIIGSAIRDNFSPVPLGPDVVEPSTGITSPRGSNITAYTEFNIFCDPESARSVFRIPVLRPKTVLIPLDLTYQVYTNAKVRHRLLHGSHRATHVQRIFYKLLMFYKNSYTINTNIKSGPPLYNTLAVIALLFNNRDANININIVDNSGEK